MTPWPIESLESLALPGTITDGPFGSNLTSAHYRDDGPLVVRLQNIGVGVYRHAPAHISLSHFEQLRKHEVLPGDLLVASLGASLPRACLAPADLGPAIVKADCIRVRLRPGVDPRWVNYALQRPQVQRWATNRLHGVGRQRLGLKLIRAIPVPTPPLEEQRRIVEVLEDHLSRLDAANDYLDAAEVRAAGLFDAVLAGAPELKGCPDVSLSAVLAAPLSNGRSVPTGAGGFPVLRLTALRDEDVDLSERKAGAWNAADAERFLVQRGDVFASRGNGSLHLVGRAAAVREDPDPVAFPDTMIRIRPNNAVIDSDYLVVVWNSRGTRQQIERTARTTAGIYKVNQRDLEAIHLPLPSLPQQEAIRTRVAELRASALVATGAVDGARKRSAQLRQALLAAAFSGRLTGRSSDLELAEEMAFA